MAVIYGTSNADVINAYMTSPGVVGGPATLEADRISTGDGQDQVSASYGNDSVYGGNGGDDLRGDAGLDALYGENGNDTLDGGDDNDALNGGDGGDLIHGGFGADLLAGGYGHDTFSFGTVVGSRAGYSYRADTGVGQGARDVILDFQQGQDVIDLSHINEVGPMAGPPGGPVTPGSDLAFEFIGTAAFNGGDAPQARYQIVNGHTILQLDGIRGLNADPDGVADAEIQITGSHALLATDFLL